MALWPLAVAGCMFLYGAAINRQVNNVVVVMRQKPYLLLIRRWLAPYFANRVMGHVGQYWLGVGLLLAGCDD